MMLNNSLNFIWLLSLCLIITAAIRIPAIAQDSDCKHRVNSWEIEPIPTVDNASCTKKKNPVYPSPPSHPVTPQLCIETPAPLPPPSPYVYSDGVPSDMAITGGWGKMPDGFQDYISVKPNEGSDYELKSGGHSLAFHFAFDELNKDGNHANSLTIAVLSQVDCWGRDAKHPCLPSYDLSQYTRLVFRAKGERGDEVLTAKAAVLLDTPCGDSAKLPLRKKISLTQDWQKFEIQISRGRVNLTRIISPFAIEVFARDQNSEVTVYVDDIHYE